MACGLPVVSSHRCGAAVDLIRNGENGLICDALDRAALIDHLRALRDPSLRARLGQAGRASIAHLTLANMRGELLALYQRLTQA
jgi:UDP-glucose:(heptosyl)LPS alpha-1,3-glucosyltransferase